MLSHYSNEDTIAAIATPAGVGAIAVIRVSGSDAIGCVNSLFRGKKSLNDAQSHTIHYGRVQNDDVTIDDVLVSVFRSPNSYTGEDSVEISTHGSPLISEKILELLVKKGIRLAEPGEFTKRAFLNNKIDLAQAEAVVDVINSRTEASLLGARNQLDGYLSAKVDELRAMLINASSLVELELDFAEEDLEFIDYLELERRIGVVIIEIDGLLASYKFGKVVRDGVNVALVGVPNAGKSSLLNYILKESRAIVSSIPGTTRDVIREDVVIDGILFRLYDTAGIRLTSDEIETEGVFRSREAVRNADLVILLYDVEQKLPKDLLKEILDLKEESRVIKVQNKIDLGIDYDSHSDLNISVKSGVGINNLLDLLKFRSLGTNTYSEKTAVVSNIRHFNCLIKARENLENAISSVSNKMSGEFIAVDLRNAENSLGEIIGVISSDDILNNIFSNFCIGK